MANWSSPDLIFGGICGLKSNVPTLAVLPASLTASIARQRERRAQRDDEVDARVLLELGGDRGRYRRHVGAVDVDLVALPP